MSHTHNIGGRTMPGLPVKFCTTGAGTYATFITGRVETTVRLPNGMRRPARDLEDLADVAQQKAENAMRDAERLRAAAKSFRDGELS